MSPILRGPLLQKSLLSVVLMCSVVPISGLSGIYFAIFLTLGRSGPRFGVGDVAAIAGLGVAAVGAPVLALISLILWGKRKRRGAALAIALVLLGMATIALVKFLPGSEHRIL